jgi:hypothetical protein
MEIVNEDDTPVTVAQYWLVCRACRVCCCITLLIEAVQAALLPLCEVGHGGEWAAGCESLVDRL